MLYWTGGHPYLTQKLCSALAQRKGVPTRADVDAVCSELFLSRRAQKTDDNLVFARSRLLYEETHRAALLDMYQRILDGRKIRDDATNPLHSILRLSGIVQTDRRLSDGSQPNLCPCIQQTMGTRQHARRGIAAAKAGL